MADMFLADDEMIMLATINEVYIDARFPGDMGLMHRANQPLPKQINSSYLVRPFWKGYKT